MRPQFSEREFEFGFNAECVQRHRDALIGTPFIPSQRLEALCGFDVHFRMRRGHVEHSLFLQHKVSILVSRRVSLNYVVYDLYGAPYYYFGLMRLDRSLQYAYQHEKH